MPPFVQGTASDNMSEGTAACSIIAQIENDVADAKDALLGAKVMQAFFANKSHGPEDCYLVGDCIMHATLHCCRDFKAGDQSRIAKFFPHWDGSFTVTKAFPETSSYTLHLPNSLNVFPTYHASLLKQFNKNDASLFPLCELGCPGPVVTGDGLEEYHIKQIIDKQRSSCGWQYLV
jgi:hypothetical protein